MGILALPVAAYAGEKTIKPAAEPLSRYQPMIERSPFALATETAPPPVPENAGFAKDLVLTGAVRLNDGAYIMVASRDQSQRFTLRTGETYSEISLVSVAWSDGVGKSKAVLKKGTEYGTISFDEAALRAGEPGGGTTPAGGPPQGGIPPGQGNGQPAKSPEMGGSVYPNQPAPPTGSNPGNPVFRRGARIRTAPQP